RLDPALIRPGRVDYKQYVGHMSLYQLEQMFHRFYPLATQVQLDHFLQVTQSLNKPISAAQIQGFFMYNKDNIDDVIKNIEQLPNL
ncbi:unnamed protein product, partial [Didymodactylos carnosus]